MKTDQKVIFVICVLVLLGYHGCVIKAERNYDGRLWGQWKDGKISQQEYERLKKENTYFRRAFKLKEVLTAGD